MMTIGKRIIKTFSPIESEKEYEAKFFVHIPLVAQGQAVLLIGPTGILTLNGNDKSVTSKMIRNGKYNREIIISTVPSAIEFVLQCMSKDMYNLSISVSLTCQVKFPEQIYKLHITDTCQEAINCFENTIRNIVKDYEAKDYEFLNECLNNKLNSGNSIQSGLLLNNVKVNVFVDDDQMRDHIAKMRKIREAKEIILEEQKSANEISQTSIEIGIFTSVLRGEITLEEAARKMQKYNNEAFDEQIRRIQVAQSIFKQLVESNLLSEEVAIGQIGNMLSSGQYGNIKMIQNSDNTTDIHLFEPVND